MRVLKSRAGHYVVETPPPPNVYEHISSQNYKGRVHGAKSNSLTCMPSANLYIPGLYVVMLFPRSGKSYHHLNRPPLQLQ